MNGTPHNLKPSNDIQSNDMPSQYHAISNVLIACQRSYFWKTTQPLNSYVR